MNPRLTTERLLLRGIEESDAASLLALLRDPDWLRFVGDRGVHDEAEARAYIRDRALGSFERDIYGLYVVERAEDGAWLGTCSLLQRDTLDAPDIGFAFLPVGRGAGYAYEASAALLDFARARLNFPRLLGITVPENTASIRLLEKLGLRYDHRSTDESGTELCVYAREFP